MLEERRMVVMMVMVKMMMIMMAGNNMKYNRLPLEMECNLNKLIQRWER